MNGTVDQVARDNANRAIAMIEAHERVCTERARESKTWRDNTSDKLDHMFANLSVDVKVLGDSVNGVNNRIYGVAGVIILILLGACGFLIRNNGL